MNPQAHPPRIGRYVIERLLGAGGMGAVYAAFDPQVGRRVALKVQLDATDAVAASRFAAEAEAAACVQHPGVVRIHTVGVDAGRPFIVMDLVEGESAQARLEREGAFAPAEAVAIIGAIGVAVAFAHERGVVHRDLKPHNVLLGPAGPVLTDFGLARDRRRATLTKTGDAVGTPAYMAPEQFEDLKRAGPPADVYGLGSTLYALLAGRAPFQGATPMNILVGVLHHRPPPLAVDRDLETICLTCMEKAPGDRYPDVRALLDDLARWSAGEPIAARRPAALARAWRWVRRRRRRALALVTAVALAVAGLTLAPTWRRGREHVARADVQRLVAAGDVAAAISALDDALVAEPGASDLWAWRGRLRVETGDLRGGVDDLDRALTLAPDDVDALTTRAGALRGVDRDGLERDLERLHALRPGNVGVRRDLVGLRLERADEAYARGDLDLAVAACTSALAINPQHARALALRAVARWEGSAVEPADDQAAFADLEKALLHDPRLAWAHASIARIHMSWPNVEPALAAARRAEALEPVPAHTVLRIAAELSFFKEQHRRLEGMSEFGVPADLRDFAALEREVERLEGELRRVSPLDGEGLILLADILWVQARTGEGLEAVDRALAAAPDDPRVHAARCRFLVFVGEPRSAVGALCEAVLVADRPEHRARRRSFMRQLDRDVIEPIGGVLVTSPEVPVQVAARRFPLRVAAGNIAGGLEDLDRLRSQLDEDELRGRAELEELLERTGPTTDGRWARALFVAAGRRLRQGARDEARAVARRALELAPGLAGWDHALVRLASSS